MELPTPNQNYGSLKSSAPQSPDICFFIQNHVENLLPASFTKNFKNLPVGQHPAAAVASAQPPSPPHPCLPHTVHHSALLPACEREVCEQGTRQTEDAIKRKSPARSSNHQSEGKCCCKHLNYIMTRRARKKFHTNKQAEQAETNLRISAQTTRPNPLSQFQYFPDLSPCQAAYSENEQVKS